MRTHGIIERYRRYLPVSDDARIITLAEGSTPLIQAPALSEAIHPRLDIWLKYEGMNPTGSFKDRGMTMAITKAVEQGHEAVICASTGNTSAAAAAYSARAGLKCVVLIPEGKIAEGKLSQAMIHGAKVVQVRGNFDEALKLAVAITKEHPFVLVNSLNPFRIEGQKTAAFEIMDDFQGTVPDFHVLPVGNAGNITAYWKGYKEYHAHGRVERLPRMLGFQAAGAAPIVLGRPVQNPKTFASAIRIGNPASWKAALQARDESDGVIGMVTDRQIKNAYRKLASLEGIFCEPASAAGIAGLMKLADNGFFDSDLPIKAPKVRAVCVLTGHGLKDTQSAIKAAEEPVTIDANVDAILEVIGQQTAPAV